MANAVSEFGQVTIDGVPYRIDMPSYRWRDMTDFSPRASVPGGAVVFSELLLYQPILQTDWRHGLGFHWYEDEAGYMKTVGRLDTRQAGLTMMFTDSTTVNTHEGGSPSNQQKIGFTYFNSKLWAWGAGGLWYLDTVTTPTWKCVYNTAAVNFVLSTKSYLFYCPDGARIRKVDTSGTHSDAGVGSTADDFLWLIVSNGYIYAGVDDTNQIHRSSDAELDDLEGDTTDPNTIYAGAGGYEVIKACNYVGYLYFARQDGLWQYGTDGISRCVIDYTSESSPSNFASLIEYNGFLTFPIRDRLVQWNGVRRSDITPPKITDTFPYTTYGSFKNLIRIGDYLYCTARTNESTYYESLLCFDGVGWHKLTDLITNGTGTITALFFDAVNNRLWYHEDNTVDVTSYIQFQSLSVFPYASFPTTGTHSLYTSRMDMGYRMVYKSSPSIIIEGSGLSSTSYLKVYYAVDGGSFVAWGGIDGTTNVVDDTGTTELSDPLGTGDSTLEYHYIIIRIDFVTTSASYSPVLEGIILRFLMRPDTFYGYTLSIIGAEGYEYGGNLDSRTAKEIQDNLKDARDSKSPLEYIDPYGVTHEVYVTSVTGRAVEYHVDEAGAYPNIEQVIDVNLTEVK